MHIGKIKYLCRNCGYLYDKNLFDRNPMTRATLSGGVLCAKCDHSLEKVIPPENYAHMHYKRLSKEDLVEILI